MLVLSRLRDEGIHIDGPARVSIVRIIGKKVQLGIEADPETKVVRDEHVGRGKPSEQPRG